MSLVSIFAPDKNNPKELQGDIIFCNSKLEKKNSRRMIWEGDLFLSLFRAKVYVGWQAFEDLISNEVCFQILKEPHSPVFMISKKVDIEDVDGVSFLIQKLCDKGEEFIKKECLRMFSFVNNSVQFSEEYPSTTYPGPYFRTINGVRHRIIEMGGLPVTLKPSFAIEDTDVHIGEGSDVGDLISKAFSLSPIHEVLIQKG